MEYIKVNGIVLKKKEVGESDLLITVFSKEIGKFLLNVYGIRKSKKRSIQAFNPLSLTEFQLQSKKNFFNLQNAELIRSFRNILKNIEKLEISLYILYVVDKIYEINDENNIFFDKLVDVLCFIDDMKNFEKGYKYYVLISFLRRILTVQGVFDENELNKLMNINLIEKYNKVIQKIRVQNQNVRSIIFNYNLENDVFLLDETEKILKDVVYIYENYIKEHLNVEIKIDKFVI